MPPAASSGMATSAPRPDHDTTERVDRYERERVVRPAYTPPATSNVNVGPSWSRYVAIRGVNGIGSTRSGQWDRLNTTMLHAGTATASRAAYRVRFAVGSAVESSSSQRAPNRRGGSTKLTPSWSALKAGVFSSPEA